jgi:hydroxypyruvate isomerase
VAHDAQIMNNINCNKYEFYKIYLRIESLYHIDHPYFFYRNLNSFDILLRSIEINNIKMHKLLMLLNLNNISNIFQAIYG